MTKSWDKSHAGGLYICTVGLTINSCISAQSCTAKTPRSFSSGRFKFMLFCSYVSTSV